MRLRGTSCLLALMGLAVSFPGVRAADWYVAVGGTGEGSKEAPFDDAQRALDKAVSGDVIHVAQGEYFGKLKVGYWVIERRGLTLVGGYRDATFTERNPFKYPTVVKRHPDSKNATFEGASIRVHSPSKPVPYDHQSTTVDGFWFDRKDENSYGDLALPPDKCPGCLAVPTGSNTKPVLWFEAPDCHIRNSVFMNTALYAVRVTGDGSSIENNLFLNTNYAAIDIYGKGEKLGKGYQFPKFLIQGNTFVSAWNCCSLERGAGSFFVHNGGADVTLRGNLFHMSTGNAQSMGYAIKDEKNFKGDKWIHLLDNSFSQLRGGLATVYMTQLTASANIDFLKDLADTPWEVAGNDDENPYFELDKTWFERYVQAMPRQDPQTIKVDMDGFNKMRRMLGLPLDAGTVDLGGRYLALWYPVEHVRGGSFFRPTNPKLASRGVRAEGEFPVVRAPLLSASAAGGASTAVAAPPPDRDYQKVEWAALWTEGEALDGKAIELKTYWTKFDSVFGSGLGKKLVPYVEGADAKSHKIALLRPIPDSDSSSTVIKAYVALGSAPLSYIESNAKRPCPANGSCDSAFVVRGVVKKAGAKVGTGKAPQIVILVDTITAP